MSAKHCLLIAALLLPGCAKEVGRVPFAGEGSSGTFATLKAGRVDFWTDMNIEYDGSAELDYRIELFQDGKPVATAVCNSLEHLRTKLVWLERDRGSTQKWQGRDELQRNRAQVGADRSGRHARVRDCAKARSDCQGRSGREAMSGRWRGDVQDDRQRSRASQSGG